MAKLFQKNNTKKLSKRQIIFFVLCSVFFALFAFIDILILDLTHIPIWLFELLYVIDFILYILCLALCFLDYKFKYLFLGKNYKSQMSHLRHLRKFDSHYFDYLTPRKARHNYRIYGDILYMPLRSINHLTPLDLILTNYYGADFADKTKWQESLLIELYLCISDGRGLCGYFESLASCYDITFKELKSDIQSIASLPQKLKGLLIGTRAKKSFEYNKEYCNLSDVQLEKLEQLEKSYSNLGNKFENELLDIIGDIAVKNCKNIYRSYCTTPDVVKILINEANDQRYIIWFDKKTSAYKMQYEEFLPLFDDIPPLNNTYSWLAQKYYGLYESIELAENEIKNISNLKEIALDN